MPNVTTIRIPSNVTSSYVKDVINICKDGNLLVTYYKNCDENLSATKRILKYIDENKVDDCNWIKVNITNRPEIYSELPAHTPCTIWYKKGAQRYVFGPHRIGPDIITDMRHLRAWGY